MTHIEETAPRLSACPKCGSTEFTIYERYTQTGTILEDEPGVISCKPKDEGGIERIACSNCDATAPASLEVEFC